MPLIGVHYAASLLVVQEAIVHRHTRHLSKSIGRSLYHEPAVVEQ
jgi:hypothetical protein